MKFFFLSILATLFFSFAAQADTHINIGVEGNYPPYSYRNEKGKPIGFNIDLSRAIADTMGLKVNIQMAPWSEIRNALENKKIHAIAGMYYSRGRDKIVDFSPPYTIVHHTVIKRKDAPAISSEKDLEDKTLIVMRDDIMHDYVLKKRLSKDLIEVSSQADALRRLASGNGTYALLARVPALYWINKIGLSNLEETGLLLRPSSYCFAVAEDDIELLSDFSEGLAILKNTGRYQKIYDKWLGVLEPENRLVERVLYISLPVLLVSLLIIVLYLVWVRSLKHQVSKKTDILNHEVAIRRNSELNLYHKTRILSAMLYVSQIIVKEKDRDLLLKDTCHCLTSTGGYFSAWIALLDRDGQFVKAFESGLEGLFSHLAEQIKNKNYPDCMQHAIKGHKVIVEKNPPEKCTGCPLAVHYENKGAITACLHYNDRTFGVLSVSIPKRFLDQADELSFLAQISSDISFALYNIELEKKQIQLQRSLARANIIVENSPLVLFRWKAEEGWPVEFVSRNILQFGYSVEDFVSGDIKYDNIIHPDDYDRVAREVNEKTNKGSIQFSQEYRIVDKKGEIHWMEDRTSVERNYQGKAVAYQGVVFDITERKKAEKALRQSEKRFRVLVEEASDAFFLFDSRGNFLDVNQRASDSLGYTRDELLQMSVDQIDIEFPVGRVYEILTSFKQGQHITVSGTHREKSGRQFPVEVRLSCFEWNGRTVYLGLARDISEQRKAEAEREMLIQRLQKALNEVKTLSGLLPICAHCKKIRDDKGYWNQIETYIHKHSEAEFSHGICPECAKQLYPDLNIYPDDGNEA